MKLEENKSYEITNDLHLSKYTQSVRLNSKDPSSNYLSNETHEQFDNE